MGDCCCSKCLWRYWSWWACRINCCPFAHDQYGRMWLCIGVFSLWMMCRWFCLCNVSFVGLSEDVSQCTISKKWKYGKRTQNDGHQWSQGPLRGNVHPDAISFCKKKMMYAKCQHLFCFNKKCLVDKLIKCGGTDVLLTVYNVQDVFRCLFQSELPP